MKEKLTIPCADPHLLFRTFESLSSHAPPFFQQLAIQSLLLDFSSIQDSARFRALARARFLSESLLTDKGEIDKEALKEKLQNLEEEGCFFYPGGEEGFSGPARRFLKRLYEPELVRLIKQFHTPLCHPWAEKLVRSTLGLSSTTPLTDLDVKRAALCACLTPLRQNVGSCFATAPAILIQQDRPELLLQDLFQLLSAGKLKRTFGGVEYALPLSPSTGVGDTRKNLLAHPHAALCPGLLAACHLFGITESGRLQELIDEAGKEKKSLTVEEFIQFLCLKSESLTEQDLDREDEWEKAQVHHFQTGAFRAAVPTKILEIGRFKHKRSEALETFKGMCDNALLKAWEFTLASFSEVKLEFSKWNFYTSLGFSSQEEGGIGELFFVRINEKVEKINKQLEKYTRDYQLAFDQLRTSEVLLRNVSSEADARRLGAEYQSRAYHLRSCQDLRDDLYEKGSHYSRLFAFLLDQYAQKFPEYFQEIYDAQMQDVQEGVYEDSPAGFRLVYKHGRVDPSSWTLITNKEQYLHFLTEFFSLTQAAIVAECEWEEGESEIRDLTEQLLQHLGTPRFLESALQRMAKAHHTLLPSSPLFSLEKIEKKPWAYTSGGTMTTLLKTYYCRESEFTAESRWVESPQDLLIFILDTLKALPPRVIDPYLKEQRTGMLMHSPNHAFSLLPALIKEGWQTDEFTYTWVRDEVVAPSLRFYSAQRLSPEEQEFLFDQFSSSQKESLSDSPFPLNSVISIQQWRQALLPHLPNADLIDSVDAFLYKNLPLIPGTKVKALLQEFLSSLGRHEQVELGPMPPPFFTAALFHDLVKSAYLSLTGRLEGPLELHSRTTRIARELGTAPPTPLLFADTNWTGNDFAFVLNPGTGQLDLWRMDRALSCGQPMSQWKDWLNGKKHRPWVIFTHSYEYF